MERRSGRGCGGGATGARQGQGLLEEPVGLTRQLGELPLERLELGRRRVPPAPPAPPAGEQHLHEVEPRRHVAGCALHDPAEVRLSGRGVELDQLVQRAQLARAAPQHAVHLAARLRRAAGQLVDFGERQSDVVARRVQCRRPPDLPLGLVVAALPQLHQSEVRVAQRLIGRQRDDLAKRRFRLSELLAPQVREAERPRREDGGVALEAPSHPLPPRRLPAAAGDEEQHGDDAKTRQGVPDHGG